MTRAHRKNLERAAEVIKNGGVVAVPTDTQVGLLALALSEAAVSRVLAVKGPQRAGPISILLPHADMVGQVVSHIPDRARQAMEKGWPGPLTLVLEGLVDVLPKGITAGGTTVGVRLPGPCPALDLLELVNAPLTGTSANVSGEPGVADTRDLSEAVRGAVDFVVPGRCTLKKASSVIDLSQGTAKVLR